MAWHPSAKSQRAVLQGPAIKLEISTTANFPLTQSQPCPLTQSQPCSLKDLEQPSKQSLPHHCPTHLQQCPGLAVGPICAHQQIILHHSSSACAFMLLPLILRCAVFSCFPKRCALPAPHSHNHEFGSSSEEQVERTSPGYENMRRSWTQASTPTQNLHACLKMHTWCTTAEGCSCRHVAVWASSP